MTCALRCPELGDSEEVISISCWLVETGQHVVRGERIVELLLPGMTFDVTSPESGKLTGIEKNMDDHVQPGDILGWIEEDTV